MQKGVRLGGSDSYVVPLRFPKYILVVLQCQKLTAPEEAEEWY